MQAIRNVVGTRITRDATVVAIDAAAIKRHGNKWDTMFRGLPS
jgi:hypothetical protein